MIDLEHQHARGDQRGQGEQRDPDPGDVRGLDRDRLGEFHHRRVQGGGAPGAVEGGPAQVDGRADLPDAVQLDQPVQHVGDQDADRADGEQLQRAALAATWDEQPEQHGQHQDVAERVRDRDGLLHPGQLGAAGVREDQVDPGEQRQADGEGQRVDQAAPVLMGRPPADEAQDARGVEQVLREVGAVGGRREVRLVQVVGLDDLDDLARREAQVRGGEQVPGRRVRGPVQACPDDDGGDPAEPDPRPPDDAFGGVQVRRQR